ncbi:MAG: hypothetical protein WBM04_19665 [Candidatus Korobacteraceae bacterium]
MSKTKTFTGNVRSRSAAQSNSVEKIESPEMVWLEANARKLARHAGEWLLIQGEKLLVHSRDFADLREVIQKRQINPPFVYYVPTDDESSAVTI